MISARNRRKAVELVTEAVAAGARAVRHANAWALPSAVTSSGVIARKTRTSVRSANLQPTRGRCHQRNARSCTSVIASPMSAI